MNNMTKKYLYNIRLSESEHQMLLAIKIEHKSIAKMFKNYLRYQYGCLNEDKK